METVKQRSDVERELKKITPENHGKEHFQEWPARSDGLEKSSRTRAKPAHCM